MNVDEDQAENSSKTKRRIFVLWHSIIRRFLPQEKLIQRKKNCRMDFDER